MMKNEFWLLVDSTIAILLKLVFQSEVAPLNDVLADGVWQSGG